MKNLLLLAVGLFLFLSNKNDDPGSHDDFNLKPIVTSGDGMGIKVELSPKLDGVSLRYTLDGSAPTANSIEYLRPFFIDKTCAMKAQAFKDGQALDNRANVDFNKHKAVNKVISLTGLPAEKYSGSEKGSLINGVLGSDENCAVPEWFGFEGTDLEAKLHYGQRWDFSKVKLRFFHDKNQRIYLPEEVIVSVSDDGKTFREAGRATVPTSDSKVVGVEVPLTINSALDMKVQVRCFGPLHDGLQEVGQASWLFLDEIVVE